MGNLIEGDFEDNQELISLVDNMSMEEMQTLQQKMMQKQVGILVQKQKELEGEVKKAKDEVKKAKAEISAVKEEQEEQRELAVNSMRVNSPEYDWVNQGTFGEFLEPSVGSRTLGKLLKVVGLAKSSTGRTTPYRRFVGENKYARIRTFEHYSTTDWHYEKCLDYIDDWLEEHGHYTEFYSTETVEERKELINRLFREYC